ncbi:MAG: hypothetical protein ACRCTZ_08845 [Sarcina sp.]
MKLQKVSKRSILTLIGLYISANIFLKLFLEDTFISKIPFLGFGILFLFYLVANKIINKFWP